MDDRLGRMADDPSHVVMTHRVATGDDRETTTVET